MVCNDDDPTGAGDSGSFVLPEPDVEVEITQHCLDEIKAVEVGIVLFELLEALFVKEHAEEVTERLCGTLMSSNELRKTLFEYVAKVQHLVCRHPSLHRHAIAYTCRCTRMRASFSWLQIEKIWPSIAVPWF